ncbi:MAG: T9SS C-terminal target domain-containing protein, partial [Calditrichaeota bacterium]
YELWSDVNGTRLYTTTSDPDLQIDAYFSGNSAYVILNNLYFEDKEIGVNLIDAGDNAVQSINMRHLYLQGGEVVLDDETLASDQTTVTISDEAAIILKYTFENPISPANQCDEVKYYADDYFREITAGQPEQFNINNVALGDTGAAVLRLGLGRAHGRSLQPIVTVNGATLPVPENFMGYDQKPRETFWGVIDVPVPYDVLQANNAVSVGFVDNGGHISSVTMRVFNFNEDSISSVGSESNKVETVYPNPAINFLNINSVKQIHRVRIFNTIGQERKIQRNMDRIDISSLAAGVYLLKIEFVGGGSSVVKFTKINR